MHMACLHPRAPLTAHPICLPPPSPFSLLPSPSALRSPPPPPSPPPPSPPLPPFPPGIAFFVHADEPTNAVADCGANKLIDQVRLPPCQSRRHVLPCYAQLVVVVV